MQERFVKNLRDCFLHMADPERDREIALIEGNEKLTAALRKGKGVIAPGPYYIESASVLQASRAHGEKLFA